MSFSRANAEMEMTRESAFTLIELLVVIVIIGVLAGLALPVFQSVQNSAKKTQAKNDLVQIVTAVNAFYTEYGKYPIDTSVVASGDAFYGSGSAPAAAPSPGSAPTKADDNDSLLDVLRNNTANATNTTAVTTLNPRGIVYLDARVVKNDASPSAGVASNTATAPTIRGAWYDP